MNSTPRDPLLPSQPMPETVRQDEQMAEVVTVREYEMLTRAETAERSLAAARRALEQIRDFPYIGAQALAQVRLIAAAALPKQEPGT